MHFESALDADARAFLSRLFHSGTLNHQALEQMAAQGKCVAFVDEPLSWLVGRPAVVEYAYRQAKKERGGDDGS